MSNSFWAAFLGSAGAISVINLAIIITEEVKAHLNKVREDAFWEYIQDLEFEYDEEFD